MAQKGFAIPADIAVLPEPHRNNGLAQHAGRPAKVFIMIMCYRRMTVGGFWSGSTSSLGPRLTTWPRTLDRDK
jgi:hypothetical protein